MNVWDIIAAILSGLCASLGLGGGGIMLLYLTLFAGKEQLKSQGINLLFFIPCAIAALIFHQANKLIKWKPALWVAGGGLAGVIGGTWLADVIGGDFLRKIFAGFLLFLGLKELFAKKKENEEPHKKERGR